jgi:hypothetical protein
VCGPIILTSVDGQTWARVADDPFGAGLINDVAAYGSGAVAVGSTCTLSLVQVSPDCAPAVWISADGLSWTRIDDDAVFAGCVDCGFETSVEIYSVAVAGTRVVAVGRNTAGSAAWVSDDGTAWRLSQTGETFAGISGPDRVAVSGSGFVAWGIECGNVIENGEAVGFDCSTATWISQDGTEWDRPLAADYGSFGSVYDRAPFGSGVVGVGLVSDDFREHDSGAHAAAWFSPDGVDWTRAQVEDQAAGTMHRVISSGTWLVAFSGELPEGRTVIWVSSDGQNWSRAPIDPPELATTHVSSATLTQSGIVVLGRDHTRNEGQAIWSWTPPTP